MFRIHNLNAKQVIARRSTCLMHASERKNKINHQTKHDQTHKTAPVVKQYNTCYVILAKDDTMIDKQNNQIMPDKQLNEVPMSLYRQQ